MSVSDFIGRVVALHLRNELAADHGASADGTARYIIDCLSADQTAAIAKCVLEDPVLCQEIELKLPAYFLAKHGLPSEILTTNPVTYYRNAAIPKPVLLVANTRDEEEQSLKEFTRLGAPELQEHPELWVQVASEGLGLSPDQAKWWTKALSGLQELRLFSLDRLGAYILRTRDAIRGEGLPLLQAIGTALPALHFPKDTVLWTRVKEKSRGHVSAWKTLYSSVAKSRACYLLKQTSSQILLSEEDLWASFERTKDVIPEAIHETVQAFLRSPSGWNQAAVQLAECEWEQVKPLFDGMKREKFNLGRETLTFYEEREPGLLSDEEREHLRRLADRPATEQTDEDAEFYEAHRNELKEERKLKSAWDRFIFGKPLETEDFVAGLAGCLESLFNQESSGTQRRLRIRCDRATKKDLRDLNVDAGLYFSRRYAGLQSLLVDRVSWNVGQLFFYPKLVENWKALGRTPLNHSTARAALQLKFLLELEVELPTGGTQTYSTQLIWKFNPNTVVSQFYDDWSRLLEHPLVFCRGNRDLISAKGRFQTVDLSNVRTFVPAYDRDRGSFVPVYREANDLAIAWRRNLEEAKEQRLITADVEDELAAKFSAFQAAYTGAVRGFCEEGLAHPSIGAQLTAFTALLDAICRRAKGDRNRDLLVRPILQVGTVVIEGGPPAAVVAPWHPLRLAAIQRKAYRVAGLAHHLLTTDEVLFGDTRLFFKDLDRELAHPFYPELVLGWIEHKPELLALSDVVQDYSLHESPTIEQESSDDTNENPADGSNCVLDLVQRYLALHPHEQANMSVVLYNCDSARLPQAVVDKLGALYEDEGEIRCLVLLRHGDAGRLRELYKTIVGLSDTDAFNASEATQDFMARLRICIIADEASPPDPKDGCPYDIVFCQDVIARHARVEWYTESARPVGLEALVPARWSRRRPAAKDDMKSAVYLCCPVQSAEGWTFLTALTSFMKGDWDGVEDRRLLPARQLDFRDPKASRIFEETHNLGNWVVNYDELLDRRQLLNQNVRVIRYKQSATQGRNIVISSKASLSLLRSMVLCRIKDLNLGLSEEEYSALAEHFIQDANDISGDIVLRAAKRGRNASELMGIVLSRYLVRHELGLDRYYGWYFLDDYADWLGQREEQIADILVLSPERTADGDYRLAVVITEAKYMETANLAAKRKESQKQLLETMKRINEALFGSPTRLDRELWLARLSDLLLDGVQFPASANINLADWRRAIREGECEIYVRGYSHIFVSDPTDAADCSSFAHVASLDDAYQEVFGRPRVRDLVLRYTRNADPLQVRGALAEKRVWEEQTYRKPTDLTVTHIVHRVRKEERDDETEPTPPLEVPPNLLSSRGPAGRMTEPPSAASPPPDRDQTTAGDVARWAYPAIDGLISESLTTAEGEEDKVWVKQIENRTKNALQQFQLQAKLLRSVLTPNCVILKFAGSASLTVEQVKRRRSEFLTTHGLNLISIQPEPGVVSLAIERPTRRVITTQELWARWRASAAEGCQELLIGMREDDGDLLMLSPGKHAPHTLIAGSTGSGKSVLMQNIILGVVATNTPRQAKVVLIDPKQGVDYYQFEHLPHLKAGIIDDQQRASQELEALVVEMDARYAKLRSARVTNLTAYNQKAPEAERIPVIWVVHDEFAEWMLVEEYKEHVTAIVSRLGIKARAAGIHLVFAAQRPDANVMPMQLRANLGNRLILRVDSEGTSEIALGEIGAERLLGRGHLLAKLEGVADLCYAQVPLAEPRFIEQAVAIIRQSEPVP
jgi:S-DNA-T family DNA segregation ATPase FtsK/SpoIIIE